MVTGPASSLVARCEPLAALIEEGAPLGWAFAQWQTDGGGRLDLTWRREGVDWRISVCGRNEAEKSFQRSLHAQVSYRGALSVTDADAAWKHRALAALLAWADTLLSEGNDAPLGVLLGLADSHQPAAMTTLPTALCPLPFNALDIDQHGKLRPCCLFGEVLHDDAGQPFALRDATPEAVWGSAHLQQIRQAMRQGDRLDACSRCWSVEAHQGESKRLAVLKSESQRSVESVVAQPTLRSLTLFPSTRCNLRCRTCFGGSSSSIAHEYARLVQETPALVDLLGNGDDVPTTGEWLDDKPRFFEAAGEHLQTVERLEFLGGEPLLLDAHFDVLESYVKQGKAGRVHLSYSTNGTVMPARARELWPHFAGVNLKVSLDATGKRFEYLRFPARWEQVVAHMAQFAQIGPNVRLDANATPSAVSILYLPELLKWAEAQALPLTINTLSGAPFLDPRVLPALAKLEVRRRLTAMQPLAAPSLRQSVAAMLAQMEAEDWSGALLPTFVRHTRTLDRSRKQRFAETFPELAELLVGTVDFSGA